MLQLRNKTEVSLQNKLQRLANGEAVELNIAEALLYGIDIADLLPDEDFEIETMVGLKWQ
jgi:hypothetical protein